MSIIKNTPKVKNPLIKAVRELLEHRALWLYFLCDEAEKNGINPEKFAPFAVKRCGLYQGGLYRKASGGNSLVGLKKALFTFFARKVFEMKIVRCEDDALHIDFNYCPLLSAWQKQGCSDETCAKLCGYAMCGDGGIAESFGAVLELPQTIAKGADTCQIRFNRKSDIN